MATNAPMLLTPRQRERLLHVPPDLSDREIARYYTLTAEDLLIVKRHRGPANQLGFAVQLGLLRFPGRFYPDLTEVPPRLVRFLAEQVGVPPHTLADYGQRGSTLYEHLEELRQAFGYRNFGWREQRALARVLLPAALESDEALALIEMAFERLRAWQVIAPGVSTVERLVWIVLQLAQRRIEKQLTADLQPEHRRQLETLLQTAAGDEEAGMRPEDLKITPLAWLRQAPLSPSPPSLLQILRRIAFVQQLGLPPLPPSVPGNRQRQLARQGSRYLAPALRQFTERSRHALLRAWLHEHAQDLIDQALDMFSKMLTELLRKGDLQQEHHFQQHGGDLNAHLHVFMTALEAFLQAHAEAGDAFARVFAVVNEETLQATLDAARQIARPADLDSLDLIESRYVYRRSAFLALYRTLSWRVVQDREPALQALDHVVDLSARKKRVTALQQRVGDHTVQAPLGHLNEPWRRHAVRGDRIAPNYYEAAALVTLGARLRSGDVYVPGSRRYGDFESYLLPPPAWQRLQETGDTRLAVPDQAEDYLADRQQHLTAKVEHLQVHLDRSPGLKVDAQGHLHLTKLKTDVPPEAQALRQRLYQMLPRMALADLLLEVEGWTGFLRHLTHLSQGHPAEGERKMILLATLMGQGMNQPLTRMAEATPFTYWQLAWAADWYLREETLAAAQAELDNFVLQLPFSRIWGDGTHSSSDGMRMRMGVQAAHADRNAEYFGTGRGVTIYTHIADIWMPFRQKVISTNDSEALHVIDALCHHDTDLHIAEHYTDTGGYSDHVFALCALLGFRFAPRLCDLPDRRLFGIYPPETAGPLDYLFHERVSRRRIVTNWEAMRRVAASIRHGTVSAALLMRKLAGYPRQNQVAQALREMGRIEKTLYILDFLPDEALQRRVEGGLNKGEAVQSLARTLCVGQRGEFRDRALEEQTHRASCLYLLVAAIVTWNTVYLDQAVQTLRRQGEEVAPAVLAHVAPMGWEHLNLLGRYEFHPEHARPLTQLRPLRTEKEWIQEEP